MKTFLPLATFGSLLWSQTAHSQLLLDQTIAIDFGAFAPTVGTNFNQFDGFNNSIADQGTLAFSEQAGAPPLLITTTGASVPNVGFTVENQSGQSTSRANVDNGIAGPAPFDDATIFGDSLISNFTGANPLNEGGFFVLTFTGLDPNLDYDLVGGYQGANNNFSTLWTAGGVSILSSAVEPDVPYVTFEGLSPDSAGNLVITLTEAVTHVNVGALTLTAVTPAAAVDDDGDGIADSFEFNFFPDDLTQLNGTGDFDNDGLTDLEEFNLAVTTATFPTLSPIDDDSDNDGLLDGVEDGEGTFVSETETGTSPVNSDTDGDGFSDGVETNSGVFVNAANPGTNPNLVDTDGDGFGDQFETVRGGDPLDINSLPSLLENYAAVGANWMSAAEFGEVDINGDGLGSDGFLFFGDFSGTPNDTLTFENRVESLPSYVSVATSPSDVTGVTSGFASFGSIDNPNLTDGSDQIAGYVFSEAEGLNNFRNLLNFTVNGLEFAQVVRVGILAGIDGNEDGRFDPSRIRIVAPDGTMVTRGGLGANPGLVNAGWVFIDITQQGDYSVQVTRRTSGGEGGAAIGGVTFDSIIDLGVDAPVLCIENDPANPGALFFSWESFPGQEYDLLSGTDLTIAPANFDVYNDGTTLFENIPASGTGTTTLSNVARVDETRFFVLQARMLPLPEIFATDFESGAAGFFTNDVPAVWELGTPNSPAGALGGTIQAANSGDNAWGTDLDGFIPANTTVVLSSPAFDLTEVSSTANLFFSENLDLEENTMGEVWVVDDATGADIGDAPIYTAIDLDVTSAGFASVGPLELPGEALGETIRFEFRYTSGNAADFLGWYIDDVRLEGL